MRIKTGIRSTTLAFAMLAAAAACGGILGLNEDDPPTNPNASDGASGGVGDGGSSGGNTEGSVDNPPRTRFCASQPSAVLCEDFDDGDAGVAKFPQRASVGPARFITIDSDASTPHALLIDVLASPSDPTYAAMQTQVQRGSNKTIEINTDVRIDAVNTANISYTHVLVVSFGAGLEPRYEVAIDPAGCSLFAYGAPEGGAAQVVSSLGTPLPVGTGSWIHMKLLLRVGDGAAVLELGPATVAFTTGKGIATDLPSFYTGPNVWVGSGTTRTGVAYDNFVVTLNP